MNLNTEDYSPRRAASAVSAIYWRKTSQLRFSPFAFPFSKHGGRCKLEGAAGSFNTGSITEFMSACQIGRSIAVKTTEKSPSEGRCKVFQNVCNLCVSQFFLIVRLPIADWIYRSVQEKRYTNDHEWIELSEDGKTGSQTAPLFQARTYDQCPHNCYR